MSTTQNFTVEGLKKLKNGRDTIQGIVDGLDRHVENYRESIAEAGSPKLDATATSLETMVAESLKPVMKESLESLDNAINVQEATLRTLGIDC